MYLFVNDAKAYVHGPPPAQLILAGHINALSHCIVLYLRLFSNMGDKTIYNKTMQYIYAKS